MFESKSEPLIPRKIFLTRLVKHIFLGLFLTCISLGIGMVGYHHFEKMGWIDAYASAAMILSGMGPISPLNTTEGKLFAGTYALFSGIIYLVIIGIIFIPVFHRFFHKLHLNLS